MAKFTFFSVDQWFMIRCCCFCIVMVNVLFQVTQAIKHCWQQIICYRYLCLHMKMHKCTFFFCIILLWFCFGLFFCFVLGFSFYNIGQTCESCWTITIHWIPPQHAAASLAVTFTVLANKTSNSGDKQGNNQTFEKYCGFWGVFLLYMGIQPTENWAICHT